MVRKIIHIDMDAFFASVEQRENPELKGKPVAVGGSSLRGVVASASYEARAYGVRSAMPSVKAKRLCPGLIFVKSNFDIYKKVSNQIRQIFHEYTDLVEPLSLDEAFLDITEAKKGPKSGTLIAQQILRRIEAETQLTASAGVSFNKFIAKVASDINKPNGMKVITPEEATAFLDQLPIEKFFGIGKVSAKKMHRLGVYCGADLKNISEMELVRHFGKAGRHYHKIVRGLDDRPVNPNRIRKSIGAERTYARDISDMEIMKKKLVQLSSIVFNYMKKTDNFGRTITIKIKTHEFKILNRSKTFIREVREPETIIQVAHELLEATFSELEKVRLLGLTVSNLSKEHKGEGIQLEFDFEKGSYL